MDEHGAKRTNRPNGHRRVPFWRNRDFWRREEAWLGAAVTGVIIAVVAGIILSNGPHWWHLAYGAFSGSSSVQASPSGPKTSKAKSPAPASGNHQHGRVPRVEGRASCNPAKMVSESSLIGWQVQPWVFPYYSTPNPSQIAKADKDYDNPDLLNRDLFNDGGYAPSTDTQLVIQNNCLGTATITDIKVKKACQPTPIIAAIFVGQKHFIESRPSGGTQLEFGLDSSDPEAKYANGQPYTSRTPVHIPGGESYPLNIRSSAQHVACRFWIQMTVVANGKTYNRTFSDDGQPFRVSALLPSVLKSKKHPYAGYGQLFVGAAASPWHNGTWVRENPKTWPARRATKSR